MNVISNRRRFILGLSALVAAPAVIRLSSLMPISAANLPKLKYVVSSGVDIGSIIELSGSVPDRFIPCDGRLIQGVKYPELYHSVRGYLPGSDDDWLPIWQEDGHESNFFPYAAPNVDGTSKIFWVSNERYQSNERYYPPTVDRFVSMTFAKCDYDLGRFFAS